MINEKDIEIYLKAKKQQMIVEILQAISIISVFLIPTAAIMELGNAYTIILAACSATLVGAAFGGGRLVSIPRRELVSLIGRIINSDADALAKLATVKDGYIPKNT